jgi:hypothetical protein
VRDKSAKPQYSFKLLSASLSRSRERARVRAKSKRATLTFILSLLKEGEEIINYGFQLASVT